MRIEKTRTREEIANFRRQEYLRRWPLSRQFEAMQDRDNGRPEKWQAMMADFARIRQDLPYPG